MGFKPIKCTRCKGLMKLNKTFERDALRRLIPDGKLRFQWKCSLCGAIKHTHRKKSSSGCKDDAFRDKMKLYMREYRKTRRVKTAEKIEH